nr:Leucine-rich repeat domain containing protein [Haemonchus contortus]
MLRYTPNLMTLELSGNELRFEPYSIRTLRSLVQLDISNNSITLFTTAFMPLTNLTVLAMDNNKLTTIDFRRLPEYLTDLSLRNNLITTVHYYPEAARNLKRIDLAGNLMNFVDGNGPVNKLPPSVKQVDLSRNRITNIKEGAFGHMKKLGLLDLSSVHLRVPVARKRCAHAEVLVQPSVTATAQPTPTSG